MSDWLANVRVPIWARLRGFFARLLRQWQGRKAAQEKRREQEIPIFKVTIVGRTRILGEKEYINITHSWDLYETPSGKKSVVFHHANRETEDECHPCYINFVKPWLHGLWRCDYDKTREKGGDPWGWKVNTNS